LPPLPSPPPSPEPAAAPVQEATPPQAPPQNPPPAAPPPPAPQPAPAGPQAPSPELQRTWYGWQILLVDAGSFFLVLEGSGLSGQAASRGEGQALAGLALLGYLGGGPTVHWAHGHVAKGFGSLGLRAGLPVAGGLLGLGVAVSSPNTSGNGFAALADIGLGVLLGLIAAPIVDVAWLAFDEAPQGESANVRPTPALRLMPTATLPRDASGRFAPTLGLAGVF
jgi:hypothetical protein